MNVDFLLGLLAGGALIAAIWRRSVVVARRNDDRRAQLNRVMRAVEKR